MHSFPGLSFSPHNGSLTRVEAFGGTTVRYPRSTACPCAMQMNFSCMSIYITFTPSRGYNEDIFTSVGFQFRRVSLLHALLHSIFFFLENALPPNSNNHILCFATKSRPLTIAINRTIPTQTTVTSERQSITLWQAILSSHAESPSSASARHFFQAGVPRCCGESASPACTFDGPR